MTKNIFLLSLSLAIFFATQTQASQLTITTNLSKIGVSGSTDDFLSGDHDGYTEGVVYSSTTIPLHISKASYEKDTTINTATASSQATQSLDISQTHNGYKIWGDTSSTANTKINSLENNNATALGEAVVDLAFTLTSDYNFDFTSDLFNAAGTGESEVELVNTSTGTIFSQIFSEDSSDLNFSGKLLAGDYTLFIGALSEAIDGDIASASVAYQLQLTAVPTPAALPLFFSGLISLVFKNRSGRKTFT